MIPAWLSKAVVPVLILAVVVLVTAFFIMQAASSFRSIVETARQQERDGRDAYWTGQIEKSNALTAQAETQQTKEALRINTETANTIADLRAKLSTLEAANAKLPNGRAVGLDRARVQLLPD